MSAVNIKNKLLAEFAQVKSGKNPKVTANIGAIVVLSGESGDRDWKTNLHDTEERLEAGIRLYKKIVKLDVKPCFIFNGTRNQNSRFGPILTKRNVKDKILLNNPPVPLASTLTQFKSLDRLNLKKLGIVTHAEHGPRTARYAKKYLKGISWLLYLVGRKRMTKNLIEEEIEKIIKYSKKGDLPLFLKKKTVAIIQARMSSSRLPGKVMMKVKSKPLLWYVVKRTYWSKLIDEVVVTTSVDKSDDIIVKFCKMNNISCYRGSLLDVLTRYYFTAKTYDAEIIVRLTSDCPLVDGRLIDKGLEVFNSQDFDYVSNSEERTYPRGFDFEIFSFDALEKAYKKAKAEAEREHVTPYISLTHKRDFKIGQIKLTGDKSHFRITVDTPEDFEVIKILIDNYRCDLMDSANITKILEAHPEITNVNQHVEQKLYGQ